IIDAVGALDLAIEAWGSRLDVHVPNASVCDMPMERSLEFGAVVGLDHLNSERQSLEDIVDELDRGLLVRPGVKVKDSQPRAVIDRGVLVVPFSAALQGRNELDIDLTAVSR